MKGQLLMHEFDILVGSFRGEVPDVPTPCVFGGKKGTNLSAAHYMSANALGARFLGMGTETGCSGQRNAASAKRAGRRKGQVVFHVVASHLPYSASGQWSVVSGQWLVTSSGVDGADH